MESGLVLALHLRPPTTDSAIRTHATTGNMIPGEDTTSQETPTVAPQSQAKWEDSGQAAQGPPTWLTLGRWGWLPLQLIGMS